MKRILNVFIVSIILLLNIAIALFPVSVDATAENKTLSGAGTYATGTYIGGTSNYANLNSDDGDTSYIYWAISSASGALYQTYNFTDFSTSYTAINSVTIHFKARRDSSSIGYVPICRISGVNYSGSVIAVSLGATYADSSYTWSTNPATGSAWTSTAINAAEFGWYVYSIGSLANTYVTYSYLAIDYTTYAIPSITTSATDNVSYSTGLHYADLNGNITDLGGYTSCTERGFVWDIVSRSPSDNLTPALSGYTNTWTDTGTFIIGTFFHTISGLSGGTTYYVRSFALNGMGYDYGDEVTFETLTNPSISVTPATSISVSTAQINASVDNDGGQDCDVRFGYGTTSQLTVAAYDNQTAWITDTYATGELPYVSLTALSGATTYYFRAEIRNDVGSSESSELNFATVNSVNEPSSIIAIPSGTTLSLNWIKGSGAPYTLVRYNTGSYPTTTSSGTLAYLGTGESVILTGLTPGITYYISTWGKSGSTYSTGYETTLATMLAYDSGSQDISNLDQATPNTTFTLTPSDTKIKNIPLLGGLVSMNSTAYKTPSNMLWYLVWVALGILIFVLLYNKANFHFALSMTATAIWFGFGATLGLTMLWIVVILLIVGLGFNVYAERR